MTNTETRQNKRFAFHFDRRRRHRSCVWPCCEHNQKSTLNTQTPHRRIQFGGSSITCFNIRRCHRRHHTDFSMNQNDWQKVADQQEILIGGRFLHRRKTQVFRIDKRKKNFYRENIELFVNGNLAFERFRLAFAVPTDELNVISSLIYDKNRFVFSPKIEITWRHLYDDEVCVCLCLC